MPPALALQPDTAALLLLPEKHCFTFARAAWWNVCHVAPAPQENFSDIQSNNWVQAAQAETRLTVGTAGHCQREQPPREVRTAKLNNHRLVPHPPLPAEQQPSYCWPWGWIRAPCSLSVGPLGPPALLWASAHQNDVWCSSGPGCMSDKSLSLSYSSRGNLHTKSPVSPDQMILQLLVLNNENQTVQFRFECVSNLKVKCLVVS